MAVPSSSAASDPHESSTASRRAPWSLGESPFAPVLLLLLCIVVASSLLRATLMASFWSSLELTGFEAGQAALAGVFADLRAGLWILWPAWIAVAFLPKFVTRSRVYRVAWRGVFAGAMALLVFDGVAEWLFWQEFGSRYNFIAVDYLVYTTEALGNIQESYPLPAILVGTAASALGLTWLLRGPIARAVQPSSWALGRRAAFLFLLSLLAFAGTEVSDPLGLGAGNRYARELAKNGTHALLDAFRSNDLDYAEFYEQRPEEDVSLRLRQLLDRGPGRFVSQDPLEITRRVEAAAPQKRNVLLVVVESLSADFVGAYGSSLGLTPHFDALAEESLVFENLYATGCRTVRGLEALALSVPPTPGRSIVKRSDNTGLSTWGQCFRDNGYDTAFLYGGYGYFDNMNAFFGGNGFDVVDRTDFSAEEVTFSTVWGVCDEDLYARTLTECDASAKAGRPFFSLVMTTSNHRPYTYPEVVDIPSGTGRHGAVQYSDYAIGKLLEGARARPWFEDTVVVIVADHCASSAGRQEVEVSKYRIPLLIHAPDLVAPGRALTLGSQVDVMPTVLGFLGLGYRHKSFGQDLMKDGRGGRAFVGNYQSLGLLEDSALTLLLPNREFKSYAVENGATGREVLTKTRLLEDTIAYYQGASTLYHSGRMRRIAPKFVGMR